LQSLRAIPVTGDAPTNWKGPYLRQVLPLDPWGRPYVFIAPGIANPNGYDLYTLGKDGKPGGTGEDADITSWNGPVHEDSRTASDRRRLTTLFVSRNGAGRSRGKRIARSDERERSRGVADTSRALSARGSVARQRGRASCAGIRRGPRTWIENSRRSAG